MDTIDLFETSVNDGEEFEEELTAAEVLQKMEDSWLNEKHSPELLESKMEIVECMMEQVKTMEENLSRLKKEDMRIPVHRMELQRIKFMVNSYLRLRLQKIQSNIFHYTKTDNDNPSRLTQEEADFAMNYKDNLSEHFNSLALRHIPGVWESAKVTPTPPAPNLSTAVFVTVREDVPGVDIKDDAGLGRDDTINLVKGSQHMVKYEAISHLVDEGSLQLI
eukprot:GFUD01009682.1.p1 GENE.GFUD01009682.1~~GFUD01009682.1.p1  ORF type:complete len:220 (+),score=67.38 GFUD01009682.1:37-696(+)